MTTDTDMWVFYDLDMVVDKLTGGIPKHPEIVKRWQEAKWPENPERKLREGDPATPAEAAARTIEDLGDQAINPEEKIAGIWTGFAEKDGQLCIEERQIRAMLKEAANIVRTMKPAQIRGKVVPLKSKVAERIFVAPHWISLGVSDASESPERPISVMTLQGPRTALKRVDVVYDAKLHCRLRVLNDGLISESLLRFLLDYACFNGVGTDRSTGSGTFTYTLTRVEEPEEEPRSRRRS